MKEKNITQGTRLFSVSRWTDGKLHIGIITVSEVRVTYTPTGRARKPVYIAHAENFSRKGEVDFEINPDWYHSTATSAVSEAMKRYIGGITSRSSEPEDRIFKSIYGENPNPTIAATEIVDVIHELKNFHSLFADAFRIDDEAVQKIAVYEGGAK